MKKNKKESLNEFSLVAILGTIALFGWISGLFSKLADEVDAYSNNRNVKVNNALKKIVKSLSSNRTFIAKIDDYVKKFGVGESMITAIMNTPQVKNQLSAYEGDEGINMTELTTELTNVLTKAMYDEAKSRGMIDKFEKKIKSTDWS